MHALRTRINTSRYGGTAPPWRPRPRRIPHKYGPAGQRRSKARWSKAVESALVKSGRKRAGQKRSKARWPKAVESALAKAVESALAKSGRKRAGQKRSKARWSKAVKSALVKSGRKCAGQMHWAQARCGPPWTPHEYGPRWSKRTRSPLTTSPGRASAATVGGSLRHAPPGRVCA
jgi:hypothetical protein